MKTDKVNKKEIKYWKSRLNHWNKVVKTAPKFSHMVTVCERELSKRLPD